MPGHRPERAHRTTPSLGSAEKVAPILDALEQCYGRPTNQPHGNVLEELVGTILSQNTSDLNADRAFDSLRQAFPDWHQLAQASDDQIVEAIRSAGLSRQKAPAIRAAVAALLDAGGADRTQWLQQAPLEEARAWLEALPGVGPKTASCVLLFALGRPALPVDTHVYRVSQRLGLLPPGVPAASAHKSLEAIVSPDDVYRFHVLLIRHGRVVCQARRPACERCVLTIWCDYYNRQRQGNVPERERSARVET
ncbi:endonuclease III [Thermomicrobiaceae bacterium CFH 74404]|uniref:Endonuclease III n=1 Tax=Thermalbibacter longus TaxID=2951981 RepID=A0AA41WCB4_9BACT|nr:endonuclease III [Thermalbibacter longus]MCM8750544.1 endonuclease III [Thermalbibacter longus]